MDIIYCEACGDNYSDEEFMLGVCCGLPLKTRQPTSEELEEHQLYREAKDRVLAESMKLNW